MEGCFDRCDCPETDSEAFYGVEGELPAVAQRRLWASWELYAPAVLAVIKFGFNQEWELLGPLT